MIFGYRVVTVFLAAVMAMGAAAQVAAQEAFSTLHERLKPGDRVSIHTSEGLVIDGRVQAIAPDALTVRPPEGGADVRVTEAQTRRVIRPDSPANGALIGALAGPVITLGWLIAAGGSDSFQQVMIGGSVLFGAAGAVTGLIVDDAIVRTVYRAPARAQAMAAPIVGPHRLGVAVRFAF